MAEAADPVARLQAALGLLAATADMQRQWLEAQRPAPIADDLTREFDEMAPLVPALLESGRISRAAGPFLRQLEAQLAFMGSVEEIWDISALGPSGEWQRVRDLAAHALAALDPPGA